MALIDTERTIIKRNKLMGSMSDTFIGLGNFGNSGLAEMAEAIVANEVAKEIIKQRYPHLKKRKSSRRRGSGKVDTQPKK